MKSRAAATGEDLEALFDSIAAETLEREAESPRPVEAATASPPASSLPGTAVGAAEDDLEALFDRISAERDGEAATAGAPVAVLADAGPPERVAADGSTDDRMFQRLGHLTRTLHESLRELGYDKKLEKAANSLPDARDRLAYIASLTGQAADRVLSAVEQGQSVQDEIDASATQLVARWDQVYAGEIGVEPFKILAGETREFLDGVTRRTAAMRGQLHEIMMAQDFHDLTGQVIKKIVDVAQMLESSLLALLIETRAVTAAEPEASLAGPQVKPAGRTDMVTNQAQVDELLESLGF